MAAEKLRDLSQPMDVALLDATVAAFYGTGSKEEVGLLLGFCFGLFWSLFVVCLVRGEMWKGRGNWGFSEPG